MLANAYEVHDLLSFRFNPSDSQIQYKNGRLHLLIKSQFVLLIVVATSHEPCHSRPCSLSSSLSPDRCRTGYQLQHLSPSYHSMNDKQQLKNECLTPTLEFHLPHSYQPQFHSRETTTGILSMFRFNGITLHERGLRAVVDGLVFMFGLFLLIGLPSSAFDLALCS